MFAYVNMFTRSLYSDIFYKYSNYSINECICVNVAHNMTLQTPNMDHFQPIISVWHNIKTNHEPNNDLSCINIDLWENY